MMKTNNLAQWIDGQTDFPENQKGQDTFEKIKHYSAQLVAPELDKQNVFENILKARETKSTTTTSIKTYVLRIAAILILLIGVLAFLKEFTLSTYKTITAQSQIVQLPDDSKVLLQPGSNLSYNAYFWFLDREVTLQGEAFFEVEKGETFSVSTPNGDVKVLGTKFNVNSFNDELNVVCYEGRVEVSQDKITEVITSDQFIVIKQGKLENLEAIQLKELPTTSQYYQIIDSNFEKVITDIERYYGANIKTGSIKTEKNFTGQLPKNNINKALDIISKTYQLHYKTIDENNFIFVGDDEK